MKVYGNIVNRIQEDAGNVKPEIGMGCTLIWWSDREAGTITKVSPSGKTIEFQIDTATRIDSNGMSDSQSYAFAPNPKSAVYTARMRKNGQFKTKAGQVVKIGYRSKYHDFGF
jgi:hypothetical protein